MKAFWFAENLLILVMLLLGLSLLLFYDYPYGWLLMGLALVYFGYSRRHLWFLWQARSAYRQGGAGAATRWYEKARGTGRLDVAGQVMLAYLWLKEGKTDQALKSLDQAERWRERAKGRPGDAELIGSYRALADWQAGQSAEARHRLESLLAGGYKTAALYGTLGWLLIEAKDFEAARRVCFEAKDYAPNDAVILDNLAALYLAENNMDSAEEITAFLEELSPGFPEAWFHAGEVHSRFGRTEDARRCFTAALERPFNALSTIRRAQVEAALARL